MNQSSRPMSLYLQGAQCTAGSERTVHEWTCARCVTPCPVSSQREDLGETQWSDVAHQPQQRKDLQRDGGRGDEEVEELPTRRHLRVHHVVHGRLMELVRVIPDMRPRIKRGKRERGFKPRECFYIISSGVARNE